jgi:cell division FtsZ-interacting protein ZapD
LGNKEEGNSLFLQHGKVFITILTLMTIMEKGNVECDKMKEHHKTRRKKDAARLYAPGELNAMIDSLCHPLAKVDKGFILVDGILHGLARTESTR